jgi:6-phosphogluconolactonase (cycloisomerase 2 family)
VFDPNFSLLYVANRFSSNVSIFKVDAASGAMTALAGSPFAVGDQNTQAGISTIAVHPSGKFLFVADALTGFWAYSVNATTGTLTALPRAPFQVDAMQPSSIVVHPNGKFVYIAGSSIPSSITTYSIDVNGGTVSKVGLPTPVADDPVDMSFDETGKFLIVANFPTAGDVSGPSTTVFSANADTGGLTLAPGSPMRTLNLPRAIAVVGNFLYEIDGASGELGIYSIGTDGSLTQRAVTLLDGKTHLSALAANASQVSGSRYLFVTDYGSEAAGGTVTAYSVDTASGNLTQAGLPVSTGGNAAGVVVARSTVNGTSTCVP